MTREQAINYLKSSGMTDEQIKTVINAFTCEDCISREEAIKATYGFERYTGINEAPYEYAESILRELPSVTPKAESEDKE